jgi:hypothetical protein
MALLNQVTIPRFDSLLSKLLGMKERSVAPSVATELIPSLAAIDVTCPENRFLRAEQLWNAHVDTRIATLPNIANALVLNPFGSRMLTVVTGWSISVSPNTGDATAIFTQGVIHPGFGLTIDGATLVALGWSFSNSAIYLDTRWASNLGGNLGHNVTPMFGPAATTGPPLGGTVFATEEIIRGGGVAGTQPLSFSSQPGRHVVLHPGSFFYIEGYPSDLAGSTQLCVEWWGYERPQEDSELRPGAT